MTNNDWREGYLKGVVDGQKIATSQYDLPIWQRVAGTLLALFGIAAVAAPELMAHLLYNVYYSLFGSEETTKADTK